MSRRVVWTTWWVAALVMACGTPPAGSLDSGTEPVDSGVSADAGSPADAGSGVDAGSSADAGASVDAGIDAGTVIDAGNATDAGGLDAGSTDAGPPPVPTGVTADGGLRQVFVAWSASSGATSYPVLRATVSGGPYTLAGTSSATAFLDTGLLDSTAYFYVVEAASDAGTSAPSAEVQATTAPPPPPVKGTIALFGISSTVFPFDGGLVLWDAGTAPTTATVLVPSVSLGGHVAGNPTASFGQGGTFGCQAAHYDLTTGHGPAPSGNAGTITFSGYSGGALPGGSTASSTITCTLASGTYVCRLGTSGPLVAATPFASGVTPLGLADAVAVVMDGGADYGAISSGAAISVAGPLSTVEDLNAQVYTPTADVALHALCGVGPCSSATVAAVQLVASPVDPRVRTSSTTWGMTTCAMLLPGSGTITIPRGALAAMLGCDASGGNCDPKLAFIQTIVAKASLPVTKVDGSGDSMTFTAGQGVQGVAPH